MDHFFATIRLSQDATKLIVYNLKPDGYKMVKQENNHDSGDEADEQNKEQAEEKGVEVISNAEAPDEVKDILAIKTLLGADK